MEQLYFWLGSMWAEAEHDRMQEKIKYEQEEIFLYPFMEWPFVSIW